MSDTKTLTAEAVSYLACNGASLDPSAQSLMRGLVDKLRELDGVKQLTPHQVERKRKVTEWLSPSSKNFMGMGVTFEEFMAVGMAERFQRSWHEQHSKERKRRIGYITELSVEHERVCAVSICGTAWITIAIEAIIEGDLAQLRDYRELMTGEYKQRHEVWNRTVELVEAAIASWPKDGREEPEESN